MSCLLIGFSTCTIAPGISSQTEFQVVKLPIVVCLTALLLLARSVAAQSSGEPARPPSAQPKALNLAIAVWAAGMTADQITTYQFSSRYRDMMREENPLINGLD